MEECLSRGWQQVDIVLVTGDSYIDHPSFGVALIGRLLESKGYRVAILSQPRWDTAEDFRRFGRPRLFYGITAGNLDSIVANYTGNGKVRDFDSFSRDGKPYRSGDKSKKNRLRPDRATIIYSNLARSAYSDTTVIQGGVEASLRRFIHYDYKQNQLRGSVLTDAKADLLIYGMAEKTLLAATKALSKGATLSALAGSCIRLPDAKFDELIGKSPPEAIVVLPSWEEIQKDRTRFLEAELIIDKHARSQSAAILAQRQQSNWLVQYPAPPPLTEEELDEVYNLPFQRTPHPSAGKVPAYEMIRHSITVVRGCSGNCSFCAITRHQGPVTTSRSERSLLLEVGRITTMADFSGTISDLGGPTANLYGSFCRKGGCKKHDCLFPRVCEHLHIDENKISNLLDAVAAVAGVKHVFISSGLRMELLLKTPALLQKLLLNHTPGSLKIAPEHSDDQLLKLMHKESHAILKQFVTRCREITDRHGKKLQLTPYVITGHPGSTEESAHDLVRSMKNLDLAVRQFQDFTATPGTLSTAMFVSGLDSRKQKIDIPSPAQRSRQRKIIEGAFHKKNQQWAKKSGKRK